MAALFALSVGALALVRLVFLFWNWPQFVHQSSALVAEALLVGLRFDAAAAAWLSLPILLLSLVPWPERWEGFWQKAAFTLFVGLQIPFLIFNMIDVELVNFVGRRLTADVLFILGEAQGKTGGMLETSWPLFLICAVAMAAQTLGAWNIVRWRPRRPHWAPRGIPARAVFGFLAVSGAVIAARGGLQNKPISFVDANVFAAPSLNNLVLNTTFNILKNLEQENLPRVRYFENREEMLSLLNGVSSERSVLDGRRPRGPQNVVILILESFGIEYMGEVNGRQGWTPFLDSLAKKSLFFRNGFANGRRSIEGVAAILTGIPALMNEPFVTSPFTANKFVGLGSLLQDHQSAFFHGGYNGTMHFDSFARSAGLQAYFGANEYPNPKDDDGTWGIFDGPFLQWTADRLGEMKTPFLATFFSLTSHHPFRVPPGMETLYPDGPLPILKTIAYTDDSLRKFFERVEKEPWFEDTLFVILADHAAQAMGPEWDNELGRYRIPILFYHPNFEWPAGIDRDQIVQQIDLLPSIADFLGIEASERIVLGRSVFVPGERTAALHLDGNYYLVAKDHFLRRGREGGAKMYAFADQGEKVPLDEPSTKKAILEDRLKAAIQYFSEGMWDNRLSTPVTR